jgi:hypothetical protein
MGMTPTQLYSIPPVTSAAQQLIKIHSDLQSEDIPIDIHPLEVRDESCVDMLVQG